MNIEVDKQKIKEHLLEIEKLLFGESLNGKNIWDVWYNPTIRFLWDPNFIENNKIWYKEKRSLLQLAEMQGGYDDMPSGENGFDITHLAFIEINEISELDSCNLKNAYYSILAYVWSSTNEDDDLSYFLDLEFKHDFEEYPNDPVLLCLYGGYQRSLLKIDTDKASHKSTEDASIPFRQVILPKGYKFALDYYEEALAVDPNNSVILGLIGCHLGFHLNHDRHSEAINFYNKSLDQNPTNKHVLFFKAEWHREQKEYEEELDCYIQILKGDPDNLAIYKLAAECLLNLKREAEALDFYEKIISKINVDKRFIGIFPEVLLAPAPLYQLLNKSEKAFSYFDNRFSKEGLNILFEGLGLMYASTEEYNTYLYDIIARLLEQKANLLESVNKQSEAKEIRKKAKSYKTIGMNKKANTEDFINFLLQQRQQAENKIFDYYKKGSVMELPYEGDEKGLRLEAKIFSFWLLTISVPADKDFLDLLHDTYSKRAKLSAKEQTIFYNKLDTRYQIYYEAFNSDCERQEKDPKAIPLIGGVIVEAIKNQNQNFSLKQGMLMTGATEDAAAYIIFMETFKYLVTVIKAYSDELEIEI